jgi:hypothetical protein
VAKILHEGAEAELRAARVVQLALDLGDQLKPRGGFSQRLLRLFVIDIGALQIEQSGDDGEVVRDAMLQLAEQGFPLLRQRGAPRLLGTEAIERLVHHVDDGNVDRDDAGEQRQDERCARVEREGPGRHQEEEPGGEGGGDPDGDRRPQAAEEGREDHRREKSQEGNAVGNLVGDGEARHERRQEGGDCKQPRACRFVPERRSPEIHRRPFVAVGIVGRKRRFRGGVVRQKRRCAARRCGPRPVALTRAA